MICQVAVLGDDTLVLFWSLEDGHQRQLLFNERNRLWMDTERGTAVRPQAANKYAEPLARILAARSN